MTDLAWIDAALTAARPQAVGALLRYFRDLDTAEEAFQDACLRALKTLAAERPAARSRRLADPGRPQRRARRRAPARPGRRRCRPRRRSPISTTPRRALAERLDGAHYRDDVLRLLFICCHPDLPATQQIALALRIVSGLSVRRSPAPSWSAKRPWSSASPAPRRASPRPTCRSRRRARSSAPSGSPPSRP